MGLAVLIISQLPRDTQKIFGKILKKIKIKWSFAELSFHNFFIYYLSFSSKAAFFLIWEKRWPKYDLLRWKNISSIKKKAWARLSHFFETCLDLFSLDHFLGDRTRRQGLQIVIILKINQKHPLADRAVKLNRFIANRLTLKDKWLFFLILLLFHAAQAFIWLD